MNHQQLSIHRNRLERAARGTLLTVTALLLALPAVVRAEPGTDNRTPDVPEQLQPPGDTNKVHFHVYAVGTQNYVWNGSAWAFTGPDAMLFDADENLVGIHYRYSFNAAGAPIPAWESQSGSLVVGAAVTNAPSPNANSIPLLLLRVVSTEGPGIFEPTTYIQRVNTVGGRAPGTPGSTTGEEAHVLYTAEYYFYREQ
jgi:hypothetical protein